MARPFQSAQGIERASRERLQSTIEAAEQERGRWARELHDQTLQGLAVLRVRLADALRRRSPEALERAGTEAVAQLEREIGKLRSLITELRPAALDEIGLEAALRTVTERMVRDGLSLETRVRVPDEQRLGSPALETTIYRLVQEALGNVVGHAQASRALVDLRQEDGWLSLTVRDDGVGFDPAVAAEGFGIRGMRERVLLAGGRFELRSAPGRGTVVSASFPLEARSAAPGGTAPGASSRSAAGRRDADRARPPRA